MSVDLARLDYLWQQHFDKKATDDERHELWTIISSLENERIVNSKILSEFEAIDKGQVPVTIPFPEEKANSVFETVLQARKEAAVIEMKNNRGRVVKWVAAAAIILFIVGGWWLITSRKSQVTGDKVDVAKTNDVPAPSNTRAVITLADGSKVYLDSADNGTIAQENNVSIVKNENGQIIYNREDAKTQGEIVYNTLTNPRGSKVIDMQLSDGSHVWLNAGSSVKYPVAFVGNERKVEITGEAYFEVTHDASKPFVVSKGDVSVQVLGTHFNVNAYDDEDALRVTLLEGSVQVSAKLPGLPFSAVKIKPGQQAVYIANSQQLTANSSVDLDEVMAWKNGKFSFNKADIKTVMRELARWYDLDVEYQGEIPTYKFWGDIQRELPLSETLSFLKESKVKFEIQGRKVIVKK